MNLRRRATRPLTLALAALVGLTPGCGFIARADTCSSFLDHFVPRNGAALLVVWPFVLAGLGVSAVIDQTLWSFRIAPPAARDGLDYLLLQGNGNNVILERTIAIPKTASSPLVLVGSYLARWVVPFDADDRPFGPGPDARDGGH